MAIRISKRKAGTERETEPQRIAGHRRAGASEGARLVILSPYQPDRL
ncbi:hypothetical protein GbCGDNIH3_7200 [Granulibacter bethesdensis]|uniref:Uncharacterized protein n=1 Tax=Granulibacter bethesdensis TaxID=364410 RepID=A0AAN0VEU8_9PROT|nr:hypothetical protein GbCGDNIH3_7200 [Granulibacter bethesdensis]APH58411.1 hypothetical protein GbCGDNIH7_7200 [Granulibacter bethesdensis]